MSNIIPSHSTEIVVPKNPNSETIVHKGHRSKKHPGKILRRSTEIVLHDSGKRQRITKLVLKSPVIRWRGKKENWNLDLSQPTYYYWCKTRHVTISTVVICNYIETMAFPGHINLFLHRRGFGFGLDCDRVYPIDEDLNNPDALVRKILAQEERMIRRLSKGCRQSWSH